eukprot:TRINITY_DN771_c0_g1_i1.p1 TRINITY_DN771_c0_g1~~TRINITY_DN771_c0_g1_i1.p1  ORF type:complete len:139 (-),score=28.08 TRINITY_DN771_c0_g1_i1:102-518(-)
MDMLFPFDEDKENADQSKYVEEIEEVEDSLVEDSNSNNVVENASTVESTPSKAIPNNRTLNISSNRVTLARSVPVEIPARLSSNQWADYVDDDSNDDSSKQKIHELAAKTYQDYYLKKGFDLDVPLKIPMTKNVNKFI